MGGLSTCTVIPDDVVEFPDVSRATAVSAWLPFADPAVFQVTENGLVVSSAPSGRPSRRNWTPASPDASDALAVTAIDPVTVAPFAGAVRATVGAVASPRVAVASAEGADELPAPSAATTR